MDWKQQMKRGCRSEDTLKKTMTLQPDEEAWFSEAGENHSFLVNPYYLDLAGTSDAVRRQCIPDVKELRVLPVESGDPLAEEQNSPLPRMVHRYSNRVAVLVTDQCAMYCRHCFRRSFTGKDLGALKDRELLEMTRYVGEHTEIREILLTGGDPLTLEDARILHIIRAFRAVRKDLVLRLATRMPVVLPGRITEALAGSLAGEGPLWVVTQFNHSDEITAESRRALRTLRDAGLPVVNQTVLLRGINDREEVLEELFQGLLIEGVKPYYLFQGDLAEGTAHFRVPLARGWEIMANLRSRISGLAMPVYAVDLPGGGGKIPLSESYLVEKNEKGYVFRNPEGNLFVYPDEEP